MCVVAKEKEPGVEGVRLGRLPEEKAESAADNADDSKRDQPDTLVSWRPAYSLSNGR
jgi:hypothetical protein